MTVFSRNEDFLKAATIGEWNGKDPADERFTDLLKVGNNLALGDVALKNYWFRHSVGSASFWRCSLLCYAF